MNDDIRKLNDDELDTISGGKTNDPDFSDDSDDIPEKSWSNPYKPYRPVRVAR